MPNLSTITVNDGLDTPVSHTFSQNYSGVQGVGVLLESDGTVIGDNKLTLKPADRTAAKLRPSVVLAIPTTVTETIDGVNRTTVERTAYFRGDFTFDRDHTEDERKVVLGLAKNLFAHADIESVVIDLESCQ